MRGFLLFTSIIFVAPITSLAIESSPVTGFVDGPVWADSNLAQEEKVKLYAAVFNGEKSRTDFVVEFHDGSDVLGKTEISIWPKEAKAASIDWVVEDGRHNIVAKITSAKIDDVMLDLDRVETKKMSFNVNEEAKETSASVIVENSEAKGSTKLSSLIEKISFKEGSFGEKAKDSVINILDKIDSWRSLTKTHLTESIEKIKDSRKDVDNMKPETKTMSFLHLWVVQILKFIFSVGVIFYGLGVVIAIILIRKFFAFVGWLFRKRPETV